jgi:DNA-binding transcriptional MerR regulator
MEATLMTSSGLSIMTGVPRTSIIRWADRGILKPVRDSANRRLFTLDDVTRVQEYLARKSQAAAA